jgi:hypothetical protein
MLLGLKDSGPHALAAPAFFAAAALGALRHLIHDRSATRGVRSSTSPNARVAALLAAVAAFLIFVGAFAGLRWTRFSPPCAPRPG